MLENDKFDKYILNLMLSWSISRCHKKENKKKLYCSLLTSKYLEGMYTPSNKVLTENTNTTIVVTCQPTVPFLFKPPEGPLDTHSFIYRTQPLKSHLIGSTCSAFYSKFTIALMLTTRVYRTINHT